MERSRQGQGLVAFAKVNATHVIAQLIKLQTVSVGSASVLKYLLNLEDVPFIPAKIVNVSKGRKKENWRIY